MNLNFLLIKLVRALVTVWLIVTFTFTVLQVSGDPITAIAGDEAPPEVIEHYTKKYGFDRPLHEQYFSYIANVLVGDFGISLSDETPALDLVVGAIPNTLRLGLTAFLLAVMLGIPLGILAALNRNRPIDRFVMSFAVFGFSIPNFFLGIILILVFSLSLRVLPSSGSGTALHIILPAVTLGTHIAGTLARFTRSAMLEVLNKSYMRTAKAKGLPHATRIRWHALPNAAIPIVTVIGLKLGDLIAGSIIVETVFAWPGVGRLLVNAVSSRDLAVVQAVLIIVACSMVLTNLLVDILYGWIDPRVRASSASDQE
ncbi:ABC transporter permease [Pelagibius sp.]|uniref:ABC transporter permease n=1 Tax=Pelagibius sp. TaxID=1931238 RepID=UPI003BB13A65